MTENYVVFFDQDCEFLGFSTLNLSPTSFGYFEHSNIEKTMLFSSVPVESCCITGAPKEQCGFFQVVSSSTFPDWATNDQLATTFIYAAEILRSILIYQFSFLLDRVIASERVVH